MKYFSYIFIFGVIGTICNFMMVAAFTMLANSMGMFSFTVKHLSKTHVEPKIEGEERMRRNLKGINSFSDEYKVKRKYKNYSSILGENFSKKRDFISIFRFNLIDLFRYLEETKNEETKKEEVKKGEEKKKEEKQHEGKKEGEKQHEGKKEEKKNKKKEEREKHVTDPKDMTLNLTVQEILLFASVISATDAVAALTFVSETDEPKLYSILFGEGVVNDAVCIVLYGIIQAFTQSKQRKFNLNL